MKRSLTFNGRLPGVVCEMSLPQQGEDPLRLDVTGFVGFAERGPLDIPVALHDVGQYRAVFGGDLPLARMRQGNQIVYANLQRAVQAFFDNGGQRCYVVRVAGLHCRANRFRIPGMLVWDSNAQTLRTVVAEAAWPGRWSATMGVGTQLLSQILPLAPQPIDWDEDGTFRVHLVLPTTGAIRRDDVLRLHFDGQGKPLVYCYVASVAQEDAGQRTVRGIPVLVRPQIGATQALANTMLPVPVPGSVGKMQSGECHPIDALALRLDELPGLENGYVLSMTSTTQVQQGDVLCVDCVDGESLSFPVGQVARKSASAGSTDYVLVSYTTSWKLTPVQVEKLGLDGWQPARVLLSSHQLELQMTRIDRQYILHLEAADAESILAGDVLRVSSASGGQLLFPVTDVHMPPTDGGGSSASSASSAIGDAASSSSSQPSSPSQAAQAQLISQEALWFYTAPASTWPGSGASFSSPASSASSPSHAQEYGQLLQVDLLTFNLYVSDGESVVETWNDLRFGSKALDASMQQNSAQSPAPARQSWLDVLVPTLDDLSAEIAHPAVMQRDIPGLDPTRSARLGMPEALPPASDESAVPPLYFPLCMDDLPLPDEFSGPLVNPEALASALTRQTAPNCAADNGAYYYGTDDLDDYDHPDVLFLKREPLSINGRNIDFTLADVGYRDLVNEANALLLASTDVQVNPFGGLYSLLLIDEIAIVALPDLAQRRWRRESATPPVVPAKNGTSPAVRDWSLFEACDQQPPVQPGQQNGQECQAVPDLPVIETPDEYSKDELQNLIYVQQAIVNFCAARADVLGVLSLPLHFKRREVLDWQQRFTARDDFLDGVPLSYVAVYHPWLLGHEEIPLPGAVSLLVPPDGAVCGMIAARELARGPWIAPANVPLLGVIGLSPALTDRDWSDLFNAQVNLVRHLPGQFTLLSAHTLSLEDTFLQISVRRLLIFLRKLALLLGTRYVFEVNNERFRERVQSGLETTLTILADRGAISAFEVVTDGSINTQNDYDNGRFLIAMNIAPTLPIEFITVILLRSGEDLLSVIEG
jgi:hypothetical protein